jgi:hypothetical protein
LTKAVYERAGLRYGWKKQRVISNLQKKAQALGFELVPQPEVNTVS